MAPSLHVRVGTTAAAFVFALFVVLMWGAIRDSASADDAVEVIDAPLVATESLDTVVPPSEVVVIDTTESAPAEVTETVVVAEPVVEPEPVVVVGTPDTIVTPAVEETVTVLVDLEPVGQVAGAAVIEAPTTVTTASHSTPAVHQCNADTFPTSAGWEATCDVTIENTLDSDGATQSRVTTVWCLAEAGVLPPEGCDTDVVTSNNLVTTVDQCNGILAGGSNVTCTVEVINNVPFGTPTTGVTVNQCVGSGQGGVSPGGPPTNCDPEDSSTTGATVTQCNGSANGGGGPERVQCEVVGGATALPMTVNQCNGSTAAGSTVTCGVVFTNNFAAAEESDVTPVVVTSADGAPGAVPLSATSTATGRARTAPSLPATGPSTSTVPLLALAAMALLFGSLLLAGSKRFA